MPCMMTTTITDDELINFVDEVWELYDEDGNGVLDSQEIKTLLYDLFLCVGQSLQSGYESQIFQMLDNKRTGRINKQDLFLLLQSEGEDLYE